VNPCGPCPEVRAAIAAADLRAYPDPTAIPARRALAAWLGVSEARVIVGNGAVDLLWTLARAWLRPNDVVLTVEPTFSEMAAASARAGARVEPHRLVPALDFGLDVAELDAALARLRPRLAYLCSPSNPVGRSMPPALLASLADRHPNTLFVVDISFLSLSTEHSVAAWHSSERIVWLRSLTKDHGLAGLRIGCAIAPPVIVRQLEEARPPWSVNALAQAAAIAITTGVADRFVASSRARLLADGIELQAGLQRLGLRTHASETIFVLVDLGTRRATDLRRVLLRDHRILVRDCTSFGLPHHARIAARPAGDVDRLLSALPQVLA
jgi:histidinol-phosphate/aromatic aminotransferase/cobyric acid decarboxylase-like protein